MTDSEAVTQLFSLEKPTSPVIYVDDEPSLSSMFDELNRGTGPIAADAERASGFRYSQRAYLVQLKQNDGPIYLLDPVAFDFDQNLFKPLSVERPFIFHAGSQDLPCLRELGLNPKEIFDTELGSRLAGVERVGLAAVCALFLEISLAKEHSAVDWSTRPLHEDWLTYAALDVEILHDLWQKVSAELESQSKSEIAKQEFAQVLRQPTKTPKIERWRSTSGGHLIKDKRQLAVLRELWQSREELAQKLDVSPGRLIPDTAIVWAATNKVSSRSELAHSKGFHGRASRTYIDLWWSAVERGYATKDLPELRLKAEGMPNHRTWEKRFPLAHQRLLVGKAVVDEVAAQLKFAPEHALTPDTLRRVVFEFETDLTMDDFRNRLIELSARPWQIETLAEVLFTALKSVATD